MECDPQNCKCGVCQDCIRRQEELAEAAGNEEEAQVQEEVQDEGAPFVGATARRLRFSESSWSTLSCGSLRTDTRSSSLALSPAAEDASSSSSMMTSSEERRQDSSEATLSSGSMPEISPTDVSHHSGMLAPQAFPNVPESAMSTQSLEPTSPPVQGSGSGMVPAGANTRAELSEATSASGTQAGTSLAQVTSAGAPTFVREGMDVESSEETSVSGSLEDPSSMKESSPSMHSSLLPFGSQSGYPLMGASGAVSSVRDDTLADVSNVSLSSAGIDAPSPEDQADGSCNTFPQNTRRNETPRAPSPNTAP